MYGPYLSCLNESPLDAGCPGAVIGVHDYIAHYSPYYARRMVHRITARSRQIGRHPYSGRMVPEYNDESIRELIEGGYRIVYILLENQIDVVSVRHRSKPLPGEPL